MLAGARLLFHYRNGRKKQKKTEICSLRSLTCFVSRYLYYARWRSLAFSLQKRTEKTEKNRNLLATLTYLLRQSLSLLCSLALAIFFITEKDRKNRKKQKFLPAAGEFNLNDNLNLNLNANVNLNLNDNLNTFSIYEG